MGAGVASDEVEIGGGDGISRRRDGEKTRGLGGSSQGEFRFGGANKGWEQGGEAADQENRDPVESAAEAGRVRTRMLSAGAGARLNQSAEFAVLLPASAGNRRNDLEGIEKLEGVRRMRPDVRPYNDKRVRPTRRDVDARL